MLQSNSTQLSRRYISGRRIAPTSPKSGAAPSPGARCTGVLACIARNLPRTYTDVTMSFFFEGDCSFCLYIVGARNTTGHPVWHVHSVQPRWNRRLKRRSESKISLFCATEKAASKNRKMRRHLSHKNCCKSASRLSVVGNVVALVLAATSMHCPRHDFVLYVTLHNSLTHLFLKHPLVSFSD